MRLFVSVDLPEDLADEVARVQDRLAGASGLDLTDPEQAHITLKFLGEVNKGQLPRVKNAVRRAVTEAGVGPFEAAYEGLGVFPGLGYINVVWLGVGEGGEELTRLHEAVEREVTRLGFDAEDRDFTPHVTLARMNHAGGKEHVQEVVETREPTVGTATVEEIRLTESVLTDDGPEYETVASFPL